LLRIRLITCKFQIGVMMSHCWINPVRHSLCALQVWPNMGLHYATLAKLEMLLEQPAAAARAAEAAAAILRVTHGGGCSVLQEVARTRYEAGQELAMAARIAD
jgi:hypothetical protein